MVCMQGHNTIKETEQLTQVTIAPLLHGNIELNFSFIISNCPLGSYVPTQAVLYN